MRRAGLGDLLRVLPLLFPSAPLQPGCHFGTEWETWLLAQTSRLCPALLSAVPGKGAGGPGRAPGAVTSETVCLHNPPPPSSSPVRGMGLGSPRGAKGTFFSFSEIVLTCFSLSSWTPVLSGRLRWSQTREPNSVKASPLTAPCLSWSGVCRGCFLKLVPGRSRDPGAPERPHCQVLKPSGDSLGKRGPELSQLCLQSWVEILALTFTDFVTGARLKVFRGGVRLALLSCKVGIVPAL